MQPPSDDNQPSPETLDTPGPDSVIEAIVVAPSRRPRIWTAILLPPMVIGLASVAAGTLALIGVTLLNPDSADSFRQGRLPDDFQRQFNDLLITPFGLLVTLLPEGFMIAATLLAAWLSPEKIGQRLSLGRSRLGAAAIVCCVLATPIVGEAGALIIETISGPSAQLESLQHMFRQSAGPTFFLMMLGISVLPGVCEEFLFRGYTQTRLVRVLPAWLAILITSILFALAHVDPRYALTVLPVGVWLGVVAWAGQSIWPSVACHTFNNLTSVIATRLIDESDNPWPAIRIGLTLLSAAALFVAIPLIGRTRRRHTAGQEPV